MPSQASAGQRFSRLNPGTFVSGPASDRYGRRVTGRGRSTWGKFWLAIAFVATTIAACVACSATGTEWLLALVAVGLLVVIDAVD